MIEPRQNLRVHQLVQRRKIHHHSRLRIDHAAYQHFHHIVVPVPVRVVALSIGRPVLLGR